MTDTTVAVPKYKVKTERVRPCDIKVDHRYQRGLIKAHVSRIVLEYNPKAVGVPVLSRRDDDTLWAVDGQQRTAALMRLGLGTRPIECKVHYGLTLAEEALLFGVLNKSKKVRIIDQFVADIIAGLPDAVAIEKVCSKHGFVVSGSGTDGHITCALSLQKVFRGYGQRGEKLDGTVALDKVLTITTGAFGATNAGANGKLIEALGMIVHRYGDQLDVGRMTGRIASYPGGCNGLIGAARGLSAIRVGGLSSTLAEVIVTVYNKGKGKGLEPWR